MMIRASVRMSARTDQVYDGMRPLFIRDYCRAPSYGGKVLAGTTFQEFSEVRAALIDIAAFSYQSLDLRSVLRLVMI